MNAYQPRETQTYGYDNTCLSFDPTGTLIFGYDVPANWFTKYNFESSPGSAARVRHFTGKERDSESGLDYFGARYYGSALGRFTSPDPEQAGSDPADPQTWNGYAYVSNNPLTSTDPDGLFAEKPCNPPDCWSTTVTAVVDAIALETSSLIIHSVTPSIQAGQRAFDWASQPRNGNCLAASTAAGASAGAGVGMLGLAGGPAVGITEPTAMGVGGGLGWAGGMVSCMSSNGGTGGNGGQQASGQGSPEKQSFWKSQKPFRGKTKTNGLQGKARRFFEWDHTHGDVEVYDSRGQHLGSANPETGDIIKPAVSGRRIDI